MRRSLVAVAALSSLAASTVAASPAATAASTPPGPDRPHVVVVPADPDAPPVGSAPADPRPATPVPSPSSSGPAPTNLPLRSSATTVAIPPRCQPAATTPVDDDSPIRVIVSPAPPFTVETMDPLWSAPPSTEPAWQLWFYAFRWIQPLVWRATADGHTQAVERLIGTVLRFYRSHPDRGLSTLGWDEGASLRRLETLNCLYQVTSDRRLVPAMQAEADVLFGPRYYGPPRAPVHNHGLMANLALVDAGRLIGRPDWVARARARMRNDSQMAFSPLGTTYEQSSSYQLVNISLWARAADAIDTGDPHDATVAAIRATVARAQDVVRWYTEPDGRVVQFGDADRVPGLPWPGRHGPGLFRDDRAGLVVGRSDWNSPTASLYTLRYGPRRWAHGHPDTNTITWTSRGARVVVGSGYIGNEPSDRYVRWQKSPQANNAAIPTGARLDPHATGTIRASSSRGSAQSWTLADRAFGLRHTRAVTVVDRTRTLAVSDVFAGGRGADQVWHLSPEWKPVSARPGATTMTFRHTDGQLLTVTTTARLASVKIGSTNPVAGWTFPHWGSRVPAVEVRLHWTSGTARTTFRVS